MQRTNTARLWHSRNKARDKETNRLWRLRNPDKVHIYNTKHRKAWADRNPEKIRQYARDQRKRDIANGKCQWCSNPNGGFVLCVPCREKSRVDKLWRLYKLTPEQLQKMVEQRHGLCDICARNPLPRPLCIDHDHITGEVRGLLCNECNKLLGYVRDNTGILEGAIEYLRMHRK